MALCSENMAAEVRLPNSCPVYILFTGSSNEHCHGATLLCYNVRRTMAAFFSMPVARCVTDV